MRKWIKYLCFVLVVAVAVIGLDRLLTRSPKEKFRTVNSILAIHKVQNRLKEFQTACSRLPNNNEGLQVLKSGTKECAVFQPGPSDLELNDQWDNPFIYINNGNSYRLLSLGNSWIEGRNDSEGDIFSQPE